MARYKLIKNGFTVTVIEWDGVTNYTPPEGCVVELDDGVYNYAPLNPNAAIIEQIAALEAQSQFTRKQREGIIMSESLSALDAQIATLRTQLIK